MRKTIYTLAVDGYPESITSITFPLFKTFAYKIGADLVVIDQRLHPDWPACMEKLQVAELADERRDDWSMFFDADAMIHPESFDVTEHLRRDTVLHHGLDRSTVRFTPDRFFRRDGRFLSPGNWFCVASDWCRDIWSWPADLTPADCLARIHPTVAEMNARIDRAHLIDDFVVGRNAAKFGLKVLTYFELCAQLNVQPGNFWHQYALTTDAKVARMEDVLKAWGAITEEELQSRRERFPRTG